MASVFEFPPSMRHKARFPLLIPDLPPAVELAPWFDLIDKARWYTNFGPLVQRFENEMAGFLATTVGKQPNVISASSGTLALELALLAHGLPAGGKVLLPAFTFIGTATAVVRAGLHPIFADVDADTWLLDPDYARWACTRQPIAAVLPVAALGCPVNTPHWDRFADETGIPVVVDAAGAIGNQYCGKNITTIFSTHATKPLATAEGGIAVTFDPSLARRIRQCSNFGIDSATGGFSTQLGSNGKMSEYHAAIGLAALHRWPESAASRQKLNHFYVKQLSTRTGLALQQRPVNGTYASLAVLLPHDIDPTVAGARLNEAGVETRRWYYPFLPDHAMLSGVEAMDSLPIARSISDRLLGLPFHPFLTEEDIENVIRILDREILEPMGDT